MNFTKSTIEELGYLVKEHNLVKLNPSTFKKLITIYDAKGNSKKISFINYLKEYSLKDKIKEYEIAFNGFRHITLVNKYHSQIKSQDKFDQNKLLGYSTEIQVINPYFNFVKTVDFLDSDEKTIEELLARIPQSAISEYRAKMQQVQHIKIITEIKELFANDDLIIDAFNGLITLDSFKDYQS